MADELTTPPRYSWQDLVRQARERLKASGYPTPVKPSLPVENLVMPEDVESLGSIQLANLLLRFQAWYAYGTAQVSFARADFAAFMEFYEVQLGDRMHTISLHTEGRQVKEVLKALALKADPMPRWMAKKVELEQRVRMIEALVHSLEIQCKALQAEQIRRLSAQKIEGGRAW